ncbi:unnamed protein product [Rhizophagus irregularis]|nr:unnamed protein product [Rhizophagus irregularis]
MYKELMIDKILENNVEDGILLGSLKLNTNGRKRTLTSLIYFLIYIERSKFFSSEKRVFFNGHRWQLVKEVGNQQIIIAFLVMKIVDGSTKAWKSDRSSPVHVSQVLVALRIEAGNALGFSINGKLISKKVC